MSGSGKKLFAFVVHMHNKFCHAHHIVFSEVLSNIFSPLVTIFALIRVLRVSVIDKLGHILAIQGSCHRPVPLRKTLLPQTANA